MSNSNMKELVIIAERIKRVMENEGNVNNAISMVLRNDLQVMADLVLKIEKGSDKENLALPDSIFNYFN